MIVLIGASIWGSFQPTLFETRGVALLLGFIAFSLSAFTIEKIRQLITQEITFKKFGSVFAHFSVVILLAGGLYGKMGGYVLQVPLPEGEIFREPNSHFNVRLEKFHAPMDPEHRPLQFSSDLTIWEREDKKMNVKTEMNHPFSYKGVKIYQAAYGLTSLQLEIRGPRGTKRIPVELTIDGKVLRGNMVQQLDQPGEVLILDEVTPDFAHNEKGNPVQLSTLPANPAILVFYNDHFQRDPLDAKTVGWVAKEYPQRVGPYTISLVDYKVFSGLQFRKDPGLPLALAGFGFLLVGLAFMFYFPEPNGTKR